jgi:hypothetical protein
MRNGKSNISGRAATFGKITPQVCEAARHIAPGKLLRALDAIHLATFVAARRRIADLEMLTVDQRLRAAAATS